MSFLVRLKARLRRATAALAEPQLPNHYPVTDEEIEEMYAALRHVPDRRELAQLLIEWFDGDFAPALVDELHQMVREKLSLDRVYEVSGHIPWGYAGAMWFEGLPLHRRRIATPTVRACVHLHERSRGDLAFLTPRPFCPHAVVGRWEELAPSAGLVWRFDADGRLVRQAGDRSWSAHVPRDGELDVYLDDKRRHVIHGVRAVDVERGHLIGALSSTGALVHLRQVASDL